MNYATIKPHDVANGPGVRVALFVSGCTHHCKGCFNPETWDFAYGSPFTPEVEDRLLDALSPWYIKGLSLLGGEPFEPDNQAALLPFLRRVKEKFPDKTIWCYTGYDYEADLLSGRLCDPAHGNEPGKQQILRMISAIRRIVFHSIPYSVPSRRLTHAPGWASPQLAMASRTDARLRPSLVRRYSTRGGISLNCFRSTMPSRSSS